MAHAAALHRLLGLAGELVTAPGVPRRKFDLANMRVLLAALGDPQQRFPSILIAGTNGKGSTAATLASIVAAAGYTTGLYTSPHLNRVNERIQILSRSATTREIEDGALFSRLEQVERAATNLLAEGALPAAPSFFETMTAIAFLSFANGPVDLAVLEVGMGGRLDATNVVEPLLSVITDISLDHTEWLGGTIREIAREKAGILRADGIMVTLPQHPEANEALGQIATSMNVRGVSAAYYLPGRDAGSATNTYALAPWSHSEAAPLFIASPLPGFHQQRNIALALASAAELRDSYGFVIDGAAVTEGIALTRWPGRLEMFATTANRPRFLLDVAHNPAGAWALRAALSPGILEGQRSFLVFGCMRDKAVTEMAKILFPLFDHVYLSALPSSRAASLEELSVAAAVTGTSFTNCKDPADAIKAALRDADSATAQIVVTGSVILVGAARELLL